MEEFVAASIYVWFMVTICTTDMLDEIPIFHSTESDHDDDDADDDRDRPRL